MLKLLSAAGARFGITHSDHPRVIEMNVQRTGGGTSLRFTTYEVLPADDANEALLSLTAQHPSATVDHSQADYPAAEKRLFPNG